jgi:hypothetical protein
MVCCRQSSKRAAIIQPRQRVCGAFAARLFQLAHQVVYLALQLAQGLAVALLALGDEFRDGLQGLSERLHIQRFGVLHLQVDVAYLLLERGVVLRLLLGHLGEGAQQVPSQIAQVVQLPLHELLLILSLLLQERKQPAVLACVYLLAEPAGTLLASPAPAADGSQTHTRPTHATRLPAVRVHKAHPSHHPIAVSVPVATPRGELSANRRNCFRDSAGQPSQRSK